MEKLRITIDKFIKLKNELKKFRKSLLGKGDKVKICRKYDITSDEMIMMIEYLAYERKDEKTKSHD